MVRDTFIEHLLLARDHTRLFNITLYFVIPFSSYRWRNIRLESIKVAWAIHRACKCWRWDWLHIFVPLRRNLSMTLKVFATPVNHLTIQFSNEIFKRKHFYLQLMVIPSSTLCFLGSFTWNVPLLGMTDSVISKQKRVFIEGRQEGSTNPWKCTRKLVSEPRVVKAVRLKKGECL